MGRTSHCVEGKNTVLGGGDEEKESKITETLRQIPPTDPTR